MPSNDQSTDRTTADSDRTTDHTRSERGAASMPNYYRINPPPDCQPSEYSYAQRRAEILDFVVAAGGPAGVENTRLADRYEVNRSTVKRDLDALSEYISDYLAGGEDVMFRTLTLHDRVVDDLLNEDDWRASKAAYDIHRDFVDWVNVRPGENRTDLSGEVGDTVTDLGDEAPGFLTPQNEAHFEKLAAEASEATVPNTVSPDDRDAERETDEQDASTETTGE